MTRLPLIQIDAFAERPFEGNPAAVMPLDAWLDDTVMQAIAAENNLSETAFLIASDEQGVDYDLRWFTPAAEVAMCGHATLASGHWVLGQPGAGDAVRFRTRKAGVLEVRRGEGGYELDLPA
ncbi:MAG: PhzF family phenazine biosynthesis protein, partial [Sphingomonadaceae bacterium]|nr:PhzF family phenazine biosynthesis protein [Sphingomonadaceae bacterium]